MDRVHYFFGKLFRIICLQYLVVGEMGVVRIQFSVRHKLVTQEICGNDEICLKGYLRRTQKISGNNQTTASSRAAALLDDRGNPGQLINEFPLR